MSEQYSWELELRKTAMNAILFCDACMDNWKKYKERAELRFSEGSYHLEIPMPDMDGGDKK